MAGRRSVGPRVDAKSRRAVLELCRDQLLEDLNVAPVGVKAQIVGQLRATVAELDGLPDAGKVSAVDQLAAKRAARRGGAGSDGESRAGAGVKRGGGGG